MILRCFLVRRFLDGYVDGELSEARHAEVRRHISDCARCRSYVEATVAVRQDLRALEPQTLDEAAWDEIWRKVTIGAVIGRSEAEPVRRRFRVTRHTVRARYIVAAAIAAAALLFVVGLQWFGSQGSQSMPTTATYINYHENALSDHVLLENQFYSAQTVAVSYEGR